MKDIDGPQPVLVISARAMGVRTPFHAVTRVVVIVAFLGWSVLSATVGQQQKPPTIRSGVTLVPIDVRVLDGRGNPVRDLTREDFAVREDDVQQTISLFERRLFQPGRTPDTPIEFDPTAPGGVHRPQTGRVFLIVLARLWLNSEVFGTTEAVTRFIRERLQPQDYVAIAAWGRATSFTTDHEYAASVVERLAAYQEQVDRSPDRARKIRALYGYMAQPLAAETRAELDGLFQIAGSGVQTLVPRVDRRVKDLAEQIDSHIRTLEGREHGRLGPSGRAESSMGRVLEIVSGIQYLRYIEGEKHLVHVSRYGLSLPAVEDDKSLARIASDSRVALHIVQTGGIEYYDQFGRTGMASPTSSGPGLEAQMASRHVADLTGGRAWFSQYPDKALAQLDLTTRSAYVLGYYPANAAFDGRHRRITVTVKRPRNATVLFRHSYLAQPPEVHVDYRQFIVQDRILAAAEFDEEIGDLKLALSGAARADAVDLQLRLDVEGLSLEDAEGRRSGSVQLAFFCSDERQRLVGQIWQTLSLNLTTDTYERARAEGLRTQVSVAVTARARFCKAVAYDHGGDRVGSAVTQFK